MSEGAGKSGFTPIRPNPYIVGNPVRGRSMFFGREAEFELVRAKFTDSSRGGLLIFCGERRSGKTSILFQILEKRLGPDFVPVLVDMQSMAITNQVDFFQRISEEIIDALGPEAGELKPPVFTTGSSAAAAFQRFIADILRVQGNRKLLLLFDEYELFENKIEQGALTAEVLHVLASLMEHQPVFFIFTGSQHLEQRKRPYWSFFLSKSPSWKMISYLEHSDALKLIQGPVEGLVHYAAGVVDAIWRLTAGQPFYTQAICQNIVDLLNERQTNDATPEILTAVLENIVNTPLPQMIFLWDTLSSDERLALALLAESLADDKNFAKEADLSRTIRQRKYPLDLDRPRIATALTNLFRAELLTKNDAPEPGYAFRMDLWRLWIRRMHSVWQVMREGGIDLGRKRRRPGRIVATLGVALAIPSLVLFIQWQRMEGRRQGRQEAPAAAAQRLGFLSLHASPANAAIVVEGRRGETPYEDSVTAGRDLHVQVGAPGYRDSSFIVRLDPGASISRTVALQERFGALAIVTRPAEAQIQVDGQPHGKSPVTVAGLGASRRHRVEAILPGHDPWRQDVRIRPDSTHQVVIDFKQQMVTVIVYTEPVGAEVFVDQVRKGPSPATLTTNAGRHRLEARLAGWAVADTSVDVQPDLRMLQIPLTKEPPGMLDIVVGHSAVIYIGDDLIGENVPRAGKEVPAGRYEIRINTVNGDSVRVPIEVHSRERVTYHFTKRTIERTAMGAPR